MGEIEFFISSKAGACKVAGADNGRNGLKAVCTAYGQVTVKEVGFGVEKSVLIGTYFHQVTAQKSNKRSSTARRVASLKGATFSSWTNPKSGSRTESYRYRCPLVRRRAVGESYQALCNPSLKQRETADVEIGGGDVQ